VKIAITFPQVIHIYVDNLSISLKLCAFQLYIFGIKKITTFEKIAVSLDYLLMYEYN